MFNAFLEPSCLSGIRTNEDWVVAAVALFATIKLSSPEVTGYSIRRQLVARLPSAESTFEAEQIPESEPTDFFNPGER